MSSIVERKVEFSTPWFEVISKQIGGEEAPYYSLKMPDYVSVVAITPQNELVLVRQYRPAVELYTLELPSGHAEQNETPSESARRELCEEAGFQAPHLEFLGKLLSDSGRNENRTWCYLAQGVVPTQAEFVPESGVERLLVPLNKLPEIVTNGQFNHAIHLAALMLIAARRDNLPAMLGLSHTNI